MSIQEHFERLSSLLAIEKEADFQQFQEFFKNTPLQQQREKGVCWHPLNIVESGYGLGDYPFLVVERTQQIHQPHLLWR